MQHVHVNEKGWCRKIAYCSMVETHGRCKHEIIAEQHCDDEGTRSQSESHHCVGSWKVSCIKVMGKVQVSYDSWWCSLTDI